MNNFAEKEFYSVVAGGTMLAFNAGLVNAVCIGGIFELTVSHVTGTVTRTGMSLANGEWGPLARRVGLVFFFWLGCFISGLLVGDSKFRLGRRYGVCLLVESGLFFMTYVLVAFNAPGGEYLVTMACGLQNAMASTYSGAVLRTTHMTGILTDIGVVCAALVLTKGQSPDKWKLKVLVPLLVAFIGGSFMGWYCWKYMGQHALFIPTAMIGGLGTLYWSSDIVKTGRQILKEAGEETLRRKNHLARQKANAMAFVSEQLKKLSEGPTTPDHNRLIPSSKSMPGHVKLSEDDNASVASVSDVSHPTLSETAPSSSTDQPPQSPSAAPSSGAPTSSLSPV